MLNSIFTSFVCRVLSLNRGKCVQKFRLKCTRKYNVSHITGWIADMLLCDVQELYLSVRVWLSILLPQQLYSCRTLVVLKLDGFDGAVKIDVPTLVSLPKLKILHLVDVGFVEYESISRFLFGCPALEELNIKLDGFYGAVKIHVPTLVALPKLKILHLVEVCFVDCESISTFLFGCPALEELNITRCKAEDEGVINVVAPVVTSLIISSCWPRYIDGLECKIVLDTPALLYLTVSNSPAAVYLVKELCHLIRADIHVLIEHYDSTVSEVVTDLLSGISSVQSLHFSYNSMKVIYSSKSLLPRFHNMTDLELDSMPDDGWKLLLTLLENSPHLETLVFHKGLYDEHPFRRYQWNPPPNVPSSLLYHLKVIEINFFEGKNEEWEMVTYFRCNAKVLEKVIMHHGGGTETIQITP